MPPKEVEVGDPSLGGGTVDVQHVGWLDISMHESFPMGVAQRLTGLQEQPEGLIPWKPRLCRDGEIPTFDVAHHMEVESFPALRIVEHRDHVLMLDAPHHLGGGFESLEQAGIRCQVTMQHLDGDASGGLVREQVVGEPDRAKATAAQNFLQEVSSGEPLTSGELWALAALASDLA